MLTCTSFGGLAFSSLLPVKTTFSCAAGKTLAERQQRSQQGVFWWLILLKFLKLCLGSFFPYMKRTVYSIFVVLQTRETNVQHHLEDGARAVRWSQGCALEPGRRTRTFYSALGWRRAQERGTWTGQSLFVKTVRIFSCCFVRFIQFSSPLFSRRLIKGLREWGRSSFH